MHNRLSLLTGKGGPPLARGLSVRPNHGRTLLKAIIVGFLLLSQSACFDEKQQAQKHHENGLKLLLENEPEKATLEFRNALKLDQDAIAPRVEYAKILLSQNQLQQAIGNFLKVVELEPDNFEANLALGQVLLIADQIDDATVYVEAASRLKPEDPQSLALKSMLDFRTGRMDEAELFASKALLAAPGQTAATLVLSEILIAKNEFNPAMELLDEGLKFKPKDLGLHLAKLLATEKIGSMSEIGAQLVEMHAVFPKNQNISRNLIRWHLDQDQADAAETILRKLSDRFPENPDHVFELADFLYSTQGIDAAINEVSARAGDPMLHLELTSFLAGLEFTNGQSETAIDRLTGLLSEEPTDDAADKIETQLANIYFETGSSESAAELISRVLDRNPNSSDGLKLRALLHLENDNPDGAIADLRIALDTVQDNSTIMALLAVAHERNGSIGLAQNRLALAVQNSGSGIDESLSYARFLVRDGKPDVAIAVLNDTLDKNGEVPEVLDRLARVHLLAGNWDVAQTLAQRLARVDLDDAYSQQIAAIRVAGLNGQDNFDASVGLLRARWDQNDQSDFTLDNLVRSLIMSGKPEEAAQILDDTLIKHPGNARAVLLRAAVHLFHDEAQDAEELYLSVLKSHPEFETGYLAAAGFYNSRGEQQKAAKIEANGLEKAATVTQLLHVHAVRMEKLGEYEKAIELFEQLFEMDRLSDIAANNLASNLAQHRNDAQSLARAVDISKRFRGSNVPEFLDTYGWALNRIGNYEKALVPLQTAADQLPKNLIVQMHYGLVLSNLSQIELAIDTLKTVLSTASGNLSENQIARIIDELKALELRASDQKG